MFLIYILLGLAAISMSFAAAMYYLVKEARRNNEQLKAVVNHQEDFTFLVNDGFEVKQTNFFVRNQPMEGEPNILGNVLHCKNAHDAGRCGESEECRYCPVRFVIGKSFERKEDFRGLEACMEICGPEQTVSDVDVRVDGHYVELEQDKHMVINVRDVTERQDGRPKILFVSQNAGLYDKVHRALEEQFRVLAADSLHQAMHRLMLVSTYQFHAVLTDEAFYLQNDAVTKLLVKNDHIPVFVFTSNQNFVPDGVVKCLAPDLDPKTLLDTLLDAKVA